MINIIKRNINHINTFYRKILLKLLWIGIKKEKYSEHENPGPY